VASHPGDLAVLSRALPRLQVDWGANPFVIAGPEPHPGFNMTRLVGVPGTFTGAVTFADWIGHVSRALDIGTAPLEDNRFNLSKSWLKPLELAAAGVPFVRSTTPEYEALGAGLPAAGHKEWRHQLTRLINDPDLCASEVERNHQIAARHTYDLHAESWYEALRPFVASTPARQASTSVSV
jgi:hypothetical protein